VINFFRNLKISASSFLLGFLSGVLLTWILTRLRIYAPRVMRIFRKKMGGVRESFSVSTEVRLRNDIYQFAQKQHLASNLFSLDEIAIVPKVLTPLIQTPQSLESAPTDSVSLAVPYIPDWPEMAAIYHASTMTLIEALQGGANILLAGHPGSGKTVALAWLASSMARNSPGLGILDGYLPLYVHATDILHLLHHFEEEKVNPDVAENDKPSSVNQEPISKVHISDDPVDILIKAILTYTAPLTTTRLPGIIHSALEKQRAILLIDRVDELPPHQANAITAYIISLLQKYPKLRFVVAASYDNLAGLPAIGFSMLGMAAWTDYERSIFLSRWSRLWVKWIVPLDRNSSKKIDVHYLNCWLLVNNTMLKPFEYVLKVWSAFSGDIIGTDGPSAIEAYIKRLINNVPKAQAGLERFSLQLMLNMGISSDMRDSERFVTELGFEENPLSQDSLSESVSDQPSPIKSSPIKGFSGIDTLIENGLLISYPGSHYGFSHPIFYGYFVGNALSTSDSLQQIQNQPNWTGKTLAMYYLARVGDVTPLIKYLIQEDDILHTNHLLISRWLEIAPKNRPWRTIILRTLTSILQKEKDINCLAAKIISAMALSGDAGVSIYFRQLLKSEHPNLKQLAALGCGIIAEKKSIGDLNRLLQDQSPSSRRVASLALAAIGDKQSLEILATSLLNGDEQLRRCAAEALANDPREGHPALKEGSSMEDLMVRRAVAYGLIRVNLPWATKLVENLQLEDNEWVVRNAAIQAFDELKRKKDYAPTPLVDLTETQWLIDYAAKIGTTVAPGKQGEELVVKALANGTHDEIYNALQYLREKCDAEKIEYIYAAYTNNTGEIKDLAYYVLWLMMIAGIKVSLAVKYNIK
jgi:Cdc6-like AAA superfamily ATPase